MEGLEWRAALDPWEVKVQGDVSRGVKFTPAMPSEAEGPALQKAPASLTNQSLKMNYTPEQNKWNSHSGKLILSERQTASQTVSRAATDLNLALQLSFLKFLAEHYHALHLAVALLLILYFCT